MASVYHRGKTYWIRFRHRGEEVRKSARTASKAEAERYLDQIKSEYRRLDLGGKERHTFDATAARWIKEHVLTNLKPQAGYRYLVSIRAMTPHFEGKYIDEIDRQMIADFVSARRKEGVSVGIRRDLACLSSMMTHAVNWGWLDHNQVRSFSRKAVPDSNKRVRFLTTDEAKVLLNAAGKPLQTIVAVSLFTGLRLGEILALKWRDIDTARGEITVRESKSGRPRVVPMSKSARAHFRAHQKHPTAGHVFCDEETGDPMKVGSVSKQFTRLAKAVKLKDFRFHDLRHTFASWAVQSGMDLYPLQRILGHEGPQMTQRYAHLRTDDLKRAVTRTGTVPRDFLK